MLGRALVITVSGLWVFLFFLSLGKSWVPSLCPWRLKSDFHDDQGLCKWVPWAFIVCTFITHGLPKILISCWFSLTYARHTWSSERTPGSKNLITGATSSDTGNGSLAVNLPPFPYLHMPTTLDHKGIEKWIKSNVVFFLEPQGLHFSEPTKRSIKNVNLLEHTLQHLY